jgi:hypothetical protein
MHHVFIDTNGLLQFYKYTSDDLTQLAKIAGHVMSGEITIFSTTHVSDELKRNREKVIADTLKTFRDQRFPKQFPSIAKGYTSYQGLRKKITEAEKVYRDLLEDIDTDIAAVTLQADKVLDGYLKSAKELPVDDALIARAERRMLLGKPPGKASSIGDAINWEALLKSAPVGEDMYFVTTDSDYRSPIDEDKLSAYLESEWREKKKSEIFLVRSVEKLFDKFKIGIELKANKDRESAVDALECSGSFASTHVAISRLSGLEGFSDEQLTRLFTTSVANSQVRLIMEDPDVNAFFDNLYMQNSAKVPNQFEQQYVEWFGIPF